MAMVVFWISYHMERASNPRCSLKRFCCFGHYALILLTHLEVREAGGWGWRAVRTLANMPVEGLASSFVFVLSFLYPIRPTAMGQVKTEAGVQGENWPMR